MCAINGFTGTPDPSLIERMNAANRHRGPDMSSVYLDDHIALGHNRLSIIDLSTAAGQPMKSQSGLVIVYNGELYNYRELKAELASYLFQTNSDTEVILAAYEKWGRACVKKFNGIFAFAIWDPHKKELFIARDQIGVKPLYYRFDGRNLIFSSEIKAILEHDIPRRLDRDAFNIYLRTLYVPEPYTMFEGVKKLPAAHLLILHGATLTIERYWESAPVPTSKSFDEAAHDLAELVDQAVERQLISDRPVGVYLSGGIDSTTILDAMSRKHTNIKTFSIGFDIEENEQEKFNADFMLARRSAAHYGTTHHEVLFGAQDLINYFEKTIWHLDEPLSNPIAPTMLRLSEFAKPEVSVVLTGDGGDELFGGYERHRLSLLSTYYRKLPLPLRALLDSHPRFRKFDTAPGIDRLAQFMFQKENILTEVVSGAYMNQVPYDFFNKRFFEGHDLSDFESLFINTDRRSWLLDESLSKTDKMSMAAGLEARVPLLDLDIVSFAESLPRDYKITPFATKRILKHAMRGRLPEFLFNQPKRGWFPPAAKWLRYPMVDTYVRTVLSPAYYPPTADLFNWEAIERIIDDHHSKKRYNLTIIWSLLTFQSWARQYKISL